MEIPLTGNKTEEVKSLIFSMLDILQDVGIPLEGTSRRLEKMALVCLAVGDIKTKFSEAKSASDNRFLTTREIITYENANYGENISSGSYDDIRRKARFGMGAEVLYIGDTSDKFLYKNDEILAQICFFTLEHEELPDVVAYWREKNLLFLIEAVHSAGPMSEIRVRKLKKQIEKCTAIPIFVTTFLNKKEFRKWVTEIAWETEVWIADSPEHMIHFNGYKFLEIHQ